MKLLAKIRRPSWVPPVVLAAAAVVGVGVAIGVVASRDDQSPPVAVDTVAQVTSVQQACQQWLAGDPTRADTQGWCAGMTDWMREFMSRNGMGPAMMWGDPDRMRATCKHWWTDNPPAAGAVDGQQWCDAMVDWMLAHMSGWSGRGDWDAWMNQAPMMGR